jgi:hypothetical protein
MTEDVVPVIDEITPDVKTEAKLVQLAAARESGRKKKRQRDDDIEYMRSKIDVLSSALLEKKDEDKTEEKDDIKEEDKKEEEPAPKRQRVTTVKEETQEESIIPESWTTSVIRTSAILGLGAASFYFQNHYGKAVPPETKPLSKEKKTLVQKKTFMLPLQSKTRNVLIGKSGFSS